MCRQRDTSQWIEREQQKLLPVDYFMLTVTLPFELRPLVRHNQKKVYAAMFTIASQLVKDLRGLNRNLGLIPTLSSYCTPIHEGSISILTYILSSLAGAITNLRSNGLKTKDIFYLTKKQWPVYGERGCWIT